MFIECLFLPIWINFYLDLIYSSYFFIPKNKQMIKSKLKSKIKVNLH